MKKKLGSIFSGLIVLAAVIGAIYFLAYGEAGGAPGGAAATATPPPSRSLFFEDVKAGRVEAIATQKNDQSYIVIYVLLKDSKINQKNFPRKYDYKFLELNDTQFFENIGTTLKDDPKLLPSEYGFEISTIPPTDNSVLFNIITYVLLIGGLGVVFFLFIRMQNSSNNKAISFGKVRQAPVSPHNKVTFADVEGADEEKEELQEIVDFLSDPKRYHAMGARIPKGLLLVGPPGTGKTWLARAVAGEAGVPFFSISGSDFVEMFVGVGASRVRDLFQKAKAAAPCIIFIDEIDAVGRQRGSGLGGGHDEREQTLNQLLVEMDGFTHNEGIIMIAATNRPDILDPALLRPGRFDRHITMHYPDANGREKILRLHAKNKPLADDVDMALIARMTPWMTPADLENVLNEAALLAARTRKEKITTALLREAIDRVSMGPEKKSRKVTDFDRRLVAIHEAGHAVVGHGIPGSDPVKLVTIIPRGDAGGYTLTVPEDESYNLSRTKLLDRIALYMGGHAAEEMVEGDIYTGATMDLKQATKLARRMITEFGMSTELGPVHMAEEGEVFIGRDLQSHRNVSEATATAIDAQVKRILEDARARAVTILERDRAALDRLVEALLEHEKLDGEQFLKVMKGEPVAPAEQPQEPAEQEVGH